MLKLLRKDLLLILAVAAVFLSLSYAIGFVTDRTPKTVELETAFLSGERAPKTQPTTTRVWRNPAFEKTAAFDATSLKKPVRMQAENSVNITDVNTRVIGENDEPVYAMLLEVTLPRSPDPADLDGALQATAAEVGVEASLHPADADVL